MKTYRFTLVLCLILNCPAYAGFPQSIEMNKVRELQPWVSTLDKKIKQAPEYELTKEELRQDLGDKSIVCKMIVRSQGDIESLIVTKSCGLKHADKLALKLIQAAAPFAYPPNDLPCGKDGGCTEITFLNETSRLNISVREVLPSNYLKIGQQHQVAPEAHEPTPDPESK